MISESAKKEKETEDNGAFFNNFLPVKLNALEMEEYNTHFYPKIPKDGNGPKFGDLFNMMYTLNGIATGINAAYAILRAYLDLNNVTAYSYQSNQYEKLKETDLDGFKERLQRITKDTILSHDSVSDDKFKTAMALIRDSKLFVDRKTVKHSVPYIIKPSQRFQGGYDVFWIGQSGCSFGNSPLLGAHPEMNHHMHVGDISSVAYKKLAYAAAKAERYHEDIDAEQIYALMQNLNDYITGGHANNIQTMHKRTYSLLPIDFDFMQINNYRLDNLNILPFENLIQQNIPARFKAYKKYFSLMVVVHPNTDIKDAKIAALKNGTPYNPEEMIIEEIARSTPNISFSFAMHIPKHIANFITQSADNEEPSLVSLSQWVSQWSQYGLKKFDGTRYRQSFNKMAQANYIVSPKLLLTFAEKRKAAGAYVESGNNDQHNITVATNGALKYCPKAEDLKTIEENAKEYEKIANTALKAFYDNDVCANFDSLYVDDVIKAEQDNISVTDNLIDHIRKIQSTKGTLLSGTWDYNRLVYAGDHPSKTRTIRLDGVIPNDLTLRDFLDRPFEEAVGLITETAVKRDTKGRVLESESDFAGKSLNIETSIFAIYTALFAKGKVKSFQELLNEAKAHFNIASLTDEKVADYEDGLYVNVIDSDIIEKKDFVRTEGEKIQAMLRDVYRNANGFIGSSLYRGLSKQFTDQSSLLSEIKSSNRYFYASEDQKSGEETKLAHYKNIFNWFGGYVYYLALKQIKDADAISLFGINDDTRYPTAGNLVTTVMPYVIVLSQYVPNSDAIYKRAERLAERNQPNDSIDIEDVKVPGTQDGAQQFPHQVKAQKILRNRPQYAALDIQAGGGKTITCLTDIACTVRESGAESFKLKPLVICPDGLVKNWCEDFTRIVGSNWNYIPLTTEILKRWGFEQLDSILRNAPINTVVVVGMEFLSKANKYSVVVGGELERNSMSVEFIKNYGFNYIAIDEAHRIKSTTSERHRLVKQICNMSGVKYVRLLSGTMIPNITKDIVGIAAMFSGHIFRSKESFEKLEDEIDNLNSKDGEETDVTKRAKGQLIRDRLKETVALITVKRKEWAFMLPSPIETFIPVFLSYKEEEKLGSGINKAPNRDADLIAEAHRNIYDAVLEEDITKLMDELKKKKKGSSSDDDDSGDDSDLEEAFDEIASTLSDTGEYFFQRIDRILMDPESDPVGIEFFQKLRDEGVDTSKFVSRKIQVILERIRIHFRKTEWAAGEYEAYDIVDYKGKAYSAINPESEDGKFKSTLPPDRDTIRWKEEERGKIIIITRYNDSVDAILKNMPEDLRLVTTTLYGGNSKDQNKANFAEFQRNPDIKIIIANEQRVTEGFNLQFASRIIRAEAPWTPGEIEQTSSRIFRPDPAGYANGKMKRNVIFLDWIMCDNTLEVIKMAKLYRKTVLNCQYDEADNKDGPNGTNLYQEVMRMNPKPLSMSRGLLVGTNLLSDYANEYIGPYAKYARIRNADFERMRKTEDASMVKMVFVDVPKDYKKIEFVPYVYDQKVADPYNFQFEAFQEFMEEKKNKKYIEAVQKHIVDSGINTKHLTQKKIKVTQVHVSKLPAFKNLKVHYEGGYGVIESLGLAYRPDNPKASPIESLVIRTSSGALATVKLSQTQVFIINNLDKSNEAIFKNSKSILTRERTGRAIPQKEKSVDEIIDDIVDDEEEEEVLPPPRKPEKPKVVLKPKVRLIPTVYNQYVALEIQAVDDTDNESIEEALSAVKGVKFEYKDKYAYLPIHNKKAFQAVGLFIYKSGFRLAAPSAKALQAIKNSFIVDTSAFSIELAPVSELRTFHLLDHKPGDKTMLRMYPMISKGRLQLVVNLATNKDFRREFVNKPIPGITSQSEKSFKIATGMHIVLVDNKQRLGEVIRLVASANKLEIVNRSTLRAEFDALKTHTGKSHA